MDKKVNGLEWTGKIRKLLAGEVRYEIYVTSIESPEHWIWYGDFGQGAVEEIASGLAMMENVKKILIERA